MPHHLFFVWIAAVDNHARHELYTWSQDWPIHHQWFSLVNIHDARIKLHLFRPCCLLQTVWLICLDHCCRPSGCPRLASSTTATAAARTPTVITASSKMPRFIHRNRGVLPGPSHCYRHSNSGGSLVFYLNITNKPWVLSLPFTSSLHETNMEEIHVICCVCRQRCRLVHTLAPWCKPQAWHEDIFCSSAWGLEWLASGLPPWTQYELNWTSHS